MQASLLLAAAASLLAMQPCLAVNATPQSVLPGAATGYLVVVEAPAGARVAVYPSAASPPVEAAPAGSRGGCTVYRAGPMSLGQGARVEVVLHNGSRMVIPLRPEAAERGGHAPRRLMDAAASSAGSSGDAAPTRRAAEGATRPRPRGATGARPGSRGYWANLAIAVASLVLLLASIREHRSSPLRASPRA